MASQVLRQTWSGGLAIALLFGATACSSPPKEASQPPSVESPAASPTPASPSSTTSPTEKTATSTGGGKPASTASQTTAAVNRQVTRCLIKMAIVQDPNPPLNVRSSPDTSAQNVVGKLENGTFVSIVDEQGGWFQISEPKGWIAKDRTENSCNQKDEQVQLPSGSSVTLSDRFVGAGSHQYSLPAQQGQTLTVTAKEGPFPVVIAPDGKVLAGDPTAQEITNWSGKLPANGDYKLLLDSNFRGYAYSFVVELR